MSTQDQVRHERSATWFRSAMHQVGEFRNWVRATVSRASWLSRDRSAEVVLASSELATNAVEHGCGDNVEATIETSDDAVEVTVDSEGEMPARAWPPRHPEPGSVTGRGLTIVDSVADSVDRVVRAGRTRITARFERRSSSRERSVTDRCPPRTRGHRTRRPSAAPSLLDPEIVEPPR